MCKHVCQCMCPMPVWEQRKMSRSSTVFCLSLWDGVSPWTWTDCFVEAASSKHLQSSCLCTEDAGTSATLNIFYVGAGIWTQILLLVQLVLLPTEPYPHHPKLKLYVFVVIEKTSFSVPLLCPCVTILDSCYVRSHRLHVMPFLFPPLWALKNSQMLNRTLYLSDNKK